MNLSRYNLIKNFEGTNVAFNAMSCALAVVDEDFMTIISDIEKGKFDENKYDAELLSNMKLGGYIIDDSTDEIEQIKFFRNIEKYKSDDLALTIAPTLDCNFKCIYCYETPKHGVMSDDIQTKLIKFIEKRIEDIKTLSITWYGGEPLLAKNVIYNLSKNIVNLCEKNNVDYNAFIITNASLMDDKDILTLKKYHVRGAQVTIDGPREIHDVRRVSKNGSSSFEKLISNVNSLLNNGFDVIVRINIDKTNLHSTEELLDILKERIDKYTDLKIDFGQVSPFTEACKSIENNCFDNEQYADILLPMYAKVMERGFTMNKMSVYPKVKFNYCCTDYMSSFVVDFEGNMYKCWNDVGNEENKCATLCDENQEYLSGNIKWVNNDPLKYDKCRECSILLICMGGCPYKVIAKGNEPVCDSIKYNLNKVLEYYYSSLREEL